MTINNKDGKLTICLDGRIDTKNAAQTESELFAAVEAKTEDIVIDAEKLEYISSAGLRVLLKLRKSINKPLPVINVSRDVYDILETTGFTELLDVRKALREVSVEGCELIGSGGYGKVYRIDPETIVKIYNPGISLEFVEQERATSQKAFIMGVPTAISYDVVKCGDSYGVVYELLNAKTTAQLLNEDPQKLSEIFGRSAGLLKKLHSIVPDKESGLPDRKTKMLEWVDSLSDLITEEESGKIKAFINSIPDRDTFLHGDFNAKNVMVQDDEFLLIDIGDASVGHPVFDIAGIMLVYIIIPATRGGIRSDEDLIRFLGFDFEYAQKIWGVICGAYFGIKSPEEIGAITQKLMPYCLLMMTFHALSTQGDNIEAVKMRIDLVLRQRLLPAIEDVQPLDF
ncbi:MAG: anti-sigma factor antagonist [Clostridiales bacterium]|nr:anti-sigma factor antagonist [Clostridiales bacterium]